MLKIFSRRSFVIGIDQEGIEARPGTEKRCSHNLQSGPVKTWTAVFVIINIPDRRSTYSKWLAKFMCILSGGSKR